MAEPLAVVPALNTMIPLCALLAFGANVSRSPWVVQAVSRTVLLVLITLAWLSQPASKIQNLVSQLWGHDTTLLDLRSQPTKQSISNKLSASCKAIDAIKAYNPKIITEFGSEENILVNAIRLAGIYGFCLAPERILRVDWKINLSVVDYSDAFIPCQLYSFFLLARISNFYLNALEGIEIKQKN